MPTADEVLAEFDVWLGEQPDTPAKRWVLEHPPSSLRAQAVISRLYRAPALSLAAV